MAIAPELLPGQQGMDDPMGLLNDPYSGMKLGAPEFFGEPSPAILPEPLLGDRYPSNDEDYRKLLAWANAAFDAAEAAKRDHAEKWKRFYRLYRSHVERKPGDWRSTVFVPMCFWIIETVTPRLVAQLPKFRCYPVTEDDVELADTMETLLEWSADQSGLFLELVKAFKSALKYGTGILKTYHRQDVRKARKMQPYSVPLKQTIEDPVLDELGQPVVDLDGNMITERREVQVGELPMGMRSQVYQYVAYDGPGAECIDIFNFFVAPEAHDIETARYVIHRTYKEMSYILRMVEEGVYRLPDNMTVEDIVNVNNDPAMERLASIGLGANNADPTRRPVELLEYWTDDGRKIVVANRKAILQVIENPFDHSEKPFIRIVDYLQEHEFWGVGEIEPIEGLQDAQNAIANSRIDNLRMVLNSMFAVNVNHIEDLRDFRLRPGGKIRIKGDMRPDEVFQRIDLGDVTPNAFNETELIERTVEKVSGVSAYQMGLDSPSLNNTATGVAIIQEQGASRFGMKSKLIDLMGLAPLGRHFGSIIQQFATEEKVIRLTGPDGQASFQRFSPEALQGALDYSIEAESMQQSETMRQEQQMNLLGLIAQFAPQGTGAALSEVLDSFGIKDKERFLYGDPDDPMAQMFWAQQMGQMGMMGDPSMMGGGGELPPPEGPPPPDEGLGANPAEGTPGDQQAEAMLAALAQSYAEGGQF